MPIEAAEEWRSARRGSAQSDRDMDTPDNDRVAASRRVAVQVGI